MSKSDLKFKDIFKSADSQSDDSYFENKYSSYNSKKDEDKKAADAKGTAVRFFMLLKPYWFGVSIVCISSIVSTLAGVVAPDYLADIIDSIQMSIENYAMNGVAINFGNISDSTSIVYQLVTLGAVYFVIGFMTFIQQFVGAGVTQKLVFNLRQQVNVKLSNLPLSYFDKNTKG